MTGKTGSANKKSAGKLDGSLAQARAARVAAGAPPSPQLTVVQAAAPVVSGPVMKMKDLVDRASVKSGVNKKDTRAVAEQTLAALFDALAAGAELNLPPMGRLKVVKEKANAGGKVLTVKLRIGGAGQGKGKSPLADE